MSVDPRPVPAGLRAVGTVKVPPSKSFTHRYLNLALLTGRPLCLHRPLLAQDTRLFLEALPECGIVVHERPARVELSPTDRPSGRRRIDCGNAGTMFRFLVASLSVVPGEWQLDGTARLRQRPVGPLVDALRRLGAEIEYLEAEGYPPLLIAGGTFGSGTTRVAAGESSQYLSALLMAALQAPGAVEIEVEDLTSRPYVRITEEVIATFGGRVERDGSRMRVEPIGRGGAKFEATVEGDYSAGAYAAAAAVLTRGRVVLEGLAKRSVQGDRRTFEILESMGGRFRWDGERVEITGSGVLQGRELRLSDLPDQVPTFAAMAPWAAGTTRIVDVAHLRIKESDRLAAMAEELRRIGAAVDELPDGLVIPGIWANSPPPSTPVVIDAHDDHRIAMSLALAGLRRPGVSIAAPKVVGKSYPGFWTDLESLLVVANGS